MEIEKTETKKRKRSPSPSSSPSPIHYVKDSPIILIDYKQLLDENADLSLSLKSAFGEEGLGILVVSNVPNFIYLRQQLLPLAHKFANLPSEIKQLYEHPTSTYSFGWSHGKESFNGVPDFAKGSYYNNPLYDQPFDDPKIIEKYSSFAHPNIWPTTHLPLLQSAFKNLGSLMVEVGLLLSKKIDSYVHSIQPSYPSNKLYNIIKTCKTTKGRLLHYFPMTIIPDQHPGSYEKVISSNEYNVDRFHPASIALGKLTNDTRAEEVAEFSANWCGWHNDHGSLTGLVPAMYLEADGKECVNPDPDAGLYIRSRQGKIVKAKIPSDCLAFQLGETEQVHSGGIFQATPHCVQGCRGNREISRETFAVFMEPMWDEEMSVPIGIDPKEAGKGSIPDCLPKGVPTLNSRWKNGMNFGDFSEATIKAFLSQ